MDQPEGHQYLILGETDLPGPRILLYPEEFGKDTETLSLQGDYFTVGHAAAEALSRAALTGEQVTDCFISSSSFSLKTYLDLKTADSTF